MATYAYHFLYIHSNIELSEFKIIYNIMLLAVLYRSSVPFSLVLLLISNGEEHALL